MNGLTIYIMYYLIGGIDGFRLLADTEFGLSTLISNTIKPTVNMKIVEKEVALKNKLKTGFKTLTE